MAMQDETQVADFVKVNPIDWGSLEKSDRATKEALVIVGLTTDSVAHPGKLALVFRDEGEIKVVDADNNEQFLRIDHDVLITFRLDQSQFSWSFDFKHGGLTLKRPPEAPNFPQYKDRYKAGPSKGGSKHEVALLCEYQSDVEEVEVHPFNFWVLIDQPGARPPLPVRIDPDIKNPPPPPGM